MKRKSSMRVIQKFNDKYVYDTCISFDGGVPVITRKKIRVLREVISDGASMSTYVVRYPGTNAISLVSKGMYRSTQEAADGVLYASVLSSIEYSEEQVALHTKNMEMYTNALKAIKRRE